MIDNISIYHLHSSLSLLDSVTKYKAYIDYASKLGMKSIGFSEHGNIFQWCGKAMYAHEKGMKYMHGCEVYLTRSLDQEERVRDNFHTVLIARNNDGVKELNSLVSRAYNSDHFYYSPRISFDEFLNTSDNIISTSACIAGPLARLEENDPYFERLLRKYTFLEVQPHENFTDQMFYNERLCEYSKREGIPLICGTDTHALTDYEFQCRKILMARKDIPYAAEDDLDLTFESVNSAEKVLNKFRKQNVLSDDLAIQAIENTNLLAEMCEDTYIDTSIKFPILYGSYEEDNKQFELTLNRKFNDMVQSGQIPEDEVELYKTDLVEEKRVFDVLNMRGYMLFMSEMFDFCRKAHIPMGPGRGSVAGCKSAYVLGITQVDPAKWGTIFSRFANEYRKEQPDCDVDTPTDMRELIFDHIIKRFGSDKTAYVLSFGTCKEKGCIDEIVGGLSKLWAMKHLHKREIKQLKKEIENLKNDKILEHRDDNEKKILEYKQKIQDFTEYDNEYEANNPYTLDYAKEIKEAYLSNKDKALKKYHDVLYYMDGLIGTEISQSVHPAGIIVSPVTLPDNYGTIIGNNGEIALSLDMQVAHDVELIKYDILGLNTINIIRDACKYAGIDYLDVNKLDFNDEAVWNDMVRNPTGLFQMESAFAFDTLRRMKPRSIEDLALLTAALRPGGASIRNDLTDRIIHKNPSEALDNLLKDNYGYLTFQEDTTRFLTDICGFDPSRADSVRRSICKKDAVKVAEALPDILNGYCKNSPKPKEEAEEEAKEFIKIIEDSAAYQFNKSHAVAYSLVTFMCGYLRCHYPIEFVASYLNHPGNDVANDISEGTKLAKDLKIEILPPQFGLSGFEYTINKSNNSISKGAGSIKYMNNEIAQELYDLYHATEGIDSLPFIQVCKLIKENTSIDSQKMEVLIKVGYFRNYGEESRLLLVYDTFNKVLKTGNLVNVNKERIPIIIQAVGIENYANDIKKDGKPGKTWRVTDIDGLMLAINDRIIHTNNVPPAPLKRKIEWQNEFIGYVGIATHQDIDIRKLYISNIIGLKSSYGDTSKPWNYRIECTSIGTGKSSVVYCLRKVYEKNGDIKTGDIIEIPKGGISKHTSKDGQKIFWNIESYRHVI